MEVVKNGLIDTCGESGGLFRRRASAHNYPNDVGEWLFSGFSLVFALLMRALAGGLSRSGTHDRPPGGSGANQTICSRELGK